MAIEDSLLKQYNQLSWDNLLRGDLGDSGKLDEIKPNLDRIKSIFDRIMGYSTLLENVPNYKRTFENVLRSFINSCNSQLLGSSYTNIAEKQNKLIFVRNLEESIISQLGAIFNYLQFVDPTNDSRQRDLEKKSKELNEKLKNVDDLTQKVQESIKISSKMAEGEEVKLYGKEFERMAEGDYQEKYFFGSKLKYKKYLFWGNKQKAKINSFMMFASLIFTSLMACIFVFGKHLVLEGDGNFIQKLWSTILEQNVLLKLVIISTGGYLVAHFSRNYSAEMNMYYVNKHRQLSLNSHQRILDAVRETSTNNDAETQNAILLQVTKAMFEIQETGYLKNGNNPIPTTQIVETVKSGVSKD